MCETSTMQTFMWQSYAGVNLNSVIRDEITLMKHLNIYCVYVCACITFKFNVHFVKLLRTSQYPHPLVYIIKFYSLMIFNF